MESIVKLYSDKPGEISSFLNKFFTTSEFKISDELLWENHYKNPTEIADIIGTFIENCQQKQNRMTWVDFLLFVKIMINIK